MAVLSVMVLIKTETQNININVTKLGYLHLKAKHLIVIGCTFSLIKSSFSNISIKLTWHP